MRFMLPVRVSNFPSDFNADVDVFTGPTHRVPQTNMRHPATSTEFSPIAWLGSHNNHLHFES